MYRLRYPLEATITAKAGLSLQIGIQCKMSVIAITLESIRQCEQFLFHQIGVPACAEILALLSGMEPSRAYFVLLPLVVKTAYSSGVCLRLRSLELDEK